MIEAYLLHHEGALTVTELQSAIARVNALGQFSYERVLWRLLGDWYYDNARYKESVAAVDHAIERARASGLLDTLATAKRGLSLARIGRRTEAEAAASLAERTVVYPLPVVLAELWLALDQREKARNLALQRYRWAWADGPPYFHYWDLKTCRDVLGILGEVEPILPPHDPTRVRPLSYEDKIRRLLQEYAEQRSA